MKEKFTAVLALLVIVFFALSGCMADGTSGEINDSSSTSNNQITISNPADSQTTNVNAETNADDDMERVVGDVSDKDAETDYDESSATKIELSGSGAVVDGEGASAAKGTVTISNAGTYILSGSFSGQVIIETTKVDIVWLILDGLDITSSEGSAIYIKQAEKVIITLADGSENTVSDGSNYSDTGDGDPDAAIYAGDDLTINGNGSLAVTGNYQHAIKTVDDLVIAGGNLDIEAEEEGLRGKDSVIIIGGNIKIDAGGDAIKSDNDEDDDAGWVLIEGGVFNITAQNNGIEAQAALKISGGDFNITASQDALHSNGSIRISGGNIRLSADDDGVHADSSLDIIGGEITVEKSYEGLEASDIVISGGQISISARDDGINAAGGSDGDMAPGDRFRQTGNYFVSVSGGYIYVDADGDGVDSNGDIYISGGTLIVDGPESGANSAIDIEQGTYSITGGTLIAAGSLQMLVTPTQSEQPTVTIIFDSTQQAGSTVALADADGNILFAVNPSKTYQSLQISSPNFVLGESYKLLYGGDISGDSFDGTYYTQGTFSNAANTAEFIVSASVTTIGPDGEEAQYAGGMPGGGMPGGGRGGGQPPNRP